MPATNSPAKAPEADPFLRKPQVAREVGLSEPTLDRMVAEGTFPRPIKIGKRAVAFLSSEVNAWKKAKIAESRGEQ